MTIAPHTVPSHHRTVPWHLPSYPRTVPSHHRTPPSYAPNIHLTSQNAFTPILNLDKVYIYIKLPHEKLLGKGLFASKKSRLEKGGLVRQPRSESVKRENVHPTHEVLIGKTNSVILFIPQNSLGPPSRWQCWTGKQHVLLRTTYSSELWLDVTDSRENGRPNARSLAVFLRNAQRSSTELAFRAIYPLLLSNHFGPPCSKSHVWRHFEASGHRIICSKQTH